jgi:hypothetical protein
MEKGNVRWQDIFWSYILYFLPTNKAIVGLVTIILTAQHSWDFLLGPKVIAATCPAHDVGR